MSSWEIRTQNTSKTSLDTKQTPWGTCFVLSWSAVAGSERHRPSASFPELPEATGPRLGRGAPGLSGCGPGVCPDGLEGDCSCHLNRAAGKGTAPDLLLEQGSVCRGRAPTLESEAGVEPPLGPGRP